MPTRLYVTFVFLLGVVASANAQGDPPRCPQKHKY